MRTSLDFRRFAWVSVKAGRSDRRWAATRVHRERARRMLAEVLQKFYTILKSAQEGNWSWPSSLFPTIPTYNPATTEWRCPTRSSNISSFKLLHCTVELLFKIRWLDWSTGRSSAFAILPARPPLGSELRRTDLPCPIDPLFAALQAASQAPMRC